MKKNTLIPVASLPDCQKSFCRFVYVINFQYERIRYRERSGENDFIIRNDIRRGIYGRVPKVKRITPCINCQNYEQISYQRNVVIAIKRRFSTQYS